MGFSEKQMQALRRSLNAGTSAPARPMAASSPISRAGTRSRKPTGSSASMPGAARPWRRAASWPGKTADHSSPSMSPKCASPCTPTGRPLSAKAMGRARVVVPRRAKSTTSLSRRPKPMPPNGRWRLSANRSGLSFTGRTRNSPYKSATAQGGDSSPPTQPRFGSHPDDTTPIPRPSHYYGRRHQGSMTELLRRDQAQTRDDNSAAPPLAPAAPALPNAKIDKSQLAIAEPKRLRDKAHLKFVASQPCLICGRQPSDPHHLRFAQPRAIGLKVSDEFTVPLCRGHHRQVHQAGNEGLGGKTCRSMPWRSQEVFGSKRIL